jgi:hypothetical protein
VTGTLKVGVEGSGGIYLEYLLSKAMEVGQKLDALALYYAGRESQLPELVVEMGRQVYAGDIQRDDAITKLVQSRIASGLPDGQDVEVLRGRISTDLDTATAMAAFKATGTAMAMGVRLRPGIDPDLAKRLEIDTSRPLSVREMTHLMSNRTALGNSIAGRKKHSEHQSVAAVFGLDPKAAPTVEQIRNVLSGKRADGSAVRAAGADTETPGQHLTAWLAGTTAPNLGKLAECVAQPDLVSAEAVRRRLASEMDTAIQAAELREAGISPLTPEARALHGLADEPIAVPAYLQSLPLAELLERRDAINDQWDRLSADAECRADMPAEGSEPEPEKPKGADKARIDSSIRKFKSACGFAADSDPTDEEMERVEHKNDLHDYRKGINATAPPIAWFDMTWNSDKSVGIAFALAPTDAEADIIWSLVQNASAVAMNYLEGQLGIGRSGAGGMGATETAKMAGVSAPHFDARPTVNVTRYDASGNEYNDERDIPGGRFDPHLHVHNPTFSSMLTASGRISSVNMNLIKGETKVFGAVGHAALATEARQYGIDVTIGQNGEARIAAIPEWLRQFMSRRTTEGTKAAEAFVKKHFDRDWNALSSEQKISLLDKGVASTRRDKDLPEAGGGDAKPERERWKKEAEGAGYKHRSVLRPDEIAAELTHEQRIKVAREAALPFMDKAMQDRAVISLGDMREHAARGLVASGLGDNPAADIEAIVETFRQQGIMVRGEKTDIIEFSTHGKDGRIEYNVTTGSTVKLEETVIAAVRTAAADRSTALTSDQIDQAAKRFLAAHPKIKPDGEQWKAQLAMAHRIGEGGRVSLSIGIAGSGKTSSVVAVLVDAMHAEGKTVYGMTVPWRSSVALRDAGVDKAVAIDAFLSRVARGKIQLDRNSVIVADEVSQIGIRHQAALLKLSAEHGCQLIEIGDPRQTQTVSSPAISLMAKAIGDEAIPKLLTTIRQATERGREVATMWREGGKSTAAAIAALQEDGRFHLVAGGADATVQRTAQLWRTLTDANKADPDYTLLVMTPTNAQALEVGKAIRSLRKEAGEVGPTDIVKQAMDPNTKETFDLPIATGDRLRLFLRTYDADVPRRGKLLGSNGDVVDVLKVSPDGLHVRNGDGEEGRVTWEGMRPWRAPKNDPIRITMGMCSTIDSAQSMTKTAAIFSLPSGSGQVTGYKAYTAMSRHVEEAHIVVSDAAERKAIVKRQRAGMLDSPRREDVIRNIANNMSRFDEKKQATDMLASAIEVRRSVGQSINRGAEAVERGAQQSGVVTDYQRSRVAQVAHHLIDAAERVIQHGQDARDRMWSSATSQVHEHREVARPRGPRLSR